MKFEKAHKQKLNTIKYRILFLAYGFMTLLFMSCENQQFRQVHKDLIGKWSLDTIYDTLGDTIFCKGGEKVIFSEGFNFIYDTQVMSDVINSRIGKYFIVHNPNRMLPTLILVPDIEIRSDTFRQRYLIKDIKSCTSTRMELVGETDVEHIPGMVAPKYKTQTLVYNKQK